MRIDKKLGIRYPLIQGGMANIATGEFAAAVSNAGALGLIGAGGMSVEQLEEQIAVCRKLTDKPFGVNLMLMNPQAPQMAELLANEKIAVITTGAGNPAAYIPKWKENGSLVMPVMTSTLIAKRLEAAGADYIIAEGTESGGHVGEMTTMAMIPQMVDALNIPVIAAGGIADGRQVLAAFALGASGVQVGTCLLASKECPIHENYKDAVLKAKDNDTVVTGRIGGTPVRILKNQMAREYVKREKEGADKMELESYTLGSLRRAVFEGDTKTGSLMAGQVAGQLKEIRTLEEIFEDMFAGARRTYEELGTMK
ncbi:MAG: DUF561 domain-containing protein [Lachnospiraceae bacterium]|nr:DUF561 domain-containing protein [Lachnospiraceae bacterium]